VTFSNTSRGEYADSQWAFGDGGTSTEENPTHIYTAVGSYTVTLSVSGPGGSGIETRPRYILAARDVVYLPLILRNR
jgi:PKD repeat protein